MKEVFKNKWVLGGICLVAGYVIAKQMAKRASAKMVVAPTGEAAVVTADGNVAPVDEMSNAVGVYHRGLKPLKTMRIGNRIVFFG